MFRSTFNISNVEIFINTSGGGVYVRGIFTKSGGGIITVYANDSVNGNVVKSSDVVPRNWGHAVYDDSSYAKHRETTAGPGVNLDSRVSGATGG
jgi:hypothetical protein